MPLPPPPANLLAQIKEAKKSSSEDGFTSRSSSSSSSANPGRSNALLAAIQAAQAAAASVDQSAVPSDKLFIYNNSAESFQFNLKPIPTEPKLLENNNEIIIVPLAPCVYRMTDYTYSKKEPILLSRCINKLNVLRCLQRECDQLNILLEGRLSPSLTRSGVGTIEENELGKTRFMELLSNCGVYQKISELIIQRCNSVSDRVAKMNKVAGDDDGKKICIPKVTVDGLSDFLQTIEDLVPSLAAAREEIKNTQSVSFHPGLGELFSPGAKLVCYPEGMEGTPLGVSCVQSYYDEELNRATNKVKRRFILVVEFVVSVGTELVFVAASEVYPEFHDVGRNMPIRDLNHRRIDPVNCQEDATLIQRLQHRGEFYASVATDNHYLEYQPNAFFPIIGGWGNNAVRPLSKSGRVMVDVHRSFLEGHVPIRGSSDGMSDTVKEAMKLFDQSKRMAVPFRTARLPGFSRGAAPKLVVSSNGKGGDSDRESLWMAWPMLTGFSCKSLIILFAL